MIQVNLISAQLNLGEFLSYSNIPADRIVSVFLFGINSLLHLELHKFHIAVCEMYENNSHVAFSSSHHKK